MRTYTLSGKGAEVHVRFSPTIDLANTPHEIALVSLQTAHTVTNIKEGYNDLHYAVPVDDGKGHITYESYVMKLPPGTYTIDDVNVYIYSALREQFKDTDAKTKMHFMLDGEENTQKCRISTSFRLDFDHAGSVGPLLGFTRKVHPTAFGEFVYSDQNVTLVKDFNVIVTCNVVESGYINNRRAHVLHQFHIDKRPSTIFEVRPPEKVFHRVTRNWIDDITIRLENPEGQLIPLRSDTELVVTLLLRTAHDDI
ncbi:hypothetical protein R5R35_000349 [Gryllus longicercus]|uniref:Uncharacterized protein n=1 Tax=Gryllus longicercus TaxID=2509291 RepID=A0AAN9VWU0_9ORTH